MCGKSGTGKTASVKKLISKLTAPGKGHGGGVRQDRVVELNCMELRDADVFQRIAQEVVEGKKAAKSGKSAKKALKAQVLSHGEDVPRVVVVLDEVDQLDKDEIIELFDWATEPDSRLALLGIANNPNYVNVALQRLAEKEIKVHLLVGCWLTGPFAG